ncbi:MAG: ABC transporter permease [Hydrotalea sp.]|nr:ABC transporter permease [Hydrotalea sp.]
MQNKPYSQIKAMLAVTKASLKAIFRSPSAVLFSIGFPLVFILVFGFLGNNRGTSVQIAFTPTSDTSNVLFQSLQKISSLKIVQKDTNLIREDLEKGRITALIHIQENSSNNSTYQINIISSEAVQPQNLAILRSLLEAVIAGVNQKQFPNNATIARINQQVEKIPGRIYRTIDFILPGQLGFSLLSAGVFGVAFLFFNLRQQLVLKRFYATPIRRGYIVVGEGLGRMLFQLMTAVIIVGIGHFAFNFTLVHGLRTFLDILLLSSFSLLLFMGFGFIVSSLAKTESTIPPFANMITLPQFLLAGTFFSIDAFPKWLQPFCNVLPLTHFNNAMRSIAFEGASITDVGFELGILAIWTVVVYAIAIKTFKWE